MVGLPGRAGRRGADILDETGADKSCGDKEDVLSCAGGANGTVLLAADAMCLAVTTVSSRFRIQKINDQGA